jgi:large subunit ribosomal protein L28
MARICELTGKRTQVGMNVSHSNRHTKRTFKPNLQEKSFESPLLGRKVTLVLSTRAIRTLDKYNGFDGYMLQVKNVRVREGFSLNAQRLHKKLVAAAAAKGVEAPKAAKKVAAPKAKAAKPAAKKAPAKAKKA